MIRFVYGLVMGTSTPYLKKRKRFMFPTLLVERDASFQVFLGGSGICARLISGDEALVFNANSGTRDEEDAAQKWAASLPSGVRAKTLILTSADEDFSEGAGLFKDVERVYVGELSEDRRARLAQALPQARIEALAAETRLQFAGETVVLIPADFGPRPYGLAVYLETRKTLLTGPLFYNHVHPLLQPGLDVGAWIAGLGGLLKRFAVDTIVPAEGDFATVQDVNDFAEYLKALSDPTVEFSNCRKNYDWMEIPGTTSLEENFDLLRKNTSEYVRIKTH